MQTRHRAAIYSRWFQCGASQKSRQFWCQNYDCRTANFAGQAFSVCHWLEAADGSHTSRHQVYRLLYAPDVRERVYEWLADELMSRNED